MMIKLRNTNMIETLLAIAIIGNGIAILFSLACMFYIELSEC